MKGNNQAYKLWLCLLCSFLLLPLEIQAQEKGGLSLKTWGN